MNFLANQEEYLRVTEYLGYQKELKGYDWNVPKMKPMDAEMYVNTSIEEGGIQELLDGGSKEIKGVTNFNGNTLVKGRIMVANGISFGWAEGNEDEEPFNLKYNYSSVPTSLQYATLVFKQSDETLFKMTIASIMNGQKEGSLYRDLGGFYLIEDLQPIDISIEFPKGVKSAIAKDKKLFVSVYTRGFETYLKR